MWWIHQSLSLMMDTHSPWHIRFSFHTDADDCPRRLNCNITFCFSDKGLQWLQTIWTFIEEFYWFIHSTLWHVFCKHPYFRTTLHYDNQVLELLLHTPAWHTAPNLKIWNFSFAWWQTDGLHFFYFYSVFYHLNFFSFLLCWNTLK